VVAWGVHQRSKAMMCTGQVPDIRVCTPASHLPYVICCRADAAAPPANAARPLRLQALGQHDAQIAPVAPVHELHPPGGARSIVLQPLAHRSFWHVYSLAGLCLQNHLLGESLASCRRAPTCLFPFIPDTSGLKAELPSAQRLCLR